MPSTPKRSKAPQGPSRGLPQFIWDDCPECKGTGFREGHHPTDCPRCKGTGQRRRRPTPAEKGVTTLEMRPAGAWRTEGHDARTARFQWQRPPSTSGPLIDESGSLCGCPVHIVASPIKGNPRHGYKVKTRVTLPNGKILSSGSCPRYPIRGGRKGALKWAFQRIRDAVAKHTIHAKVKKVA